MSKVKTDAEQTGQDLSFLVDGDVVQIADLRVLAKQTKPPSRYTEATLLDDMLKAAKFIEDNPELRRQLTVVEGLGTAATRHTFIEVLRTAGYLGSKGKFLEPTEKGVSYIQWLAKIFPEALSVELTARWESELAAIATSGDRAVFERKVEDFTTRFIDALRSSPKTAAFTTATSSSTSPTTSTESSSMDEQRTASKPTEKMLSYAKTIAQRLKVRVPDEVMVDFDVCKKFIDENKDAANRPTEKQLNYAKNIAQQKGVEIPEVALNDGRELSQWIDANK